MYTTAYVDALCEFDESPWATYSRQGKITAKAISGILRKYRIKSQRKTDGRGYVVGDFKEAIERFAKEHLPPEQSVISVMPDSNDMTDMTLNNGYDSYTP